MWAATDVATRAPQIILQIFHLLLLAAVAGAPLPLAWHIAATQGPGAPAKPTAGHRWLAVLALWVVAESLVVTSLGLTGHLWLFEVLVTESALLLTGIYLVTRHRTKARSPYDIAGLLWDPGQWPAERWLFALVVGMSVLLLVQEISIPTQDYDSLSYQLPRVVEWYQRGTLFEPMPQFPADSNVNRYPYAWNTLYVLALAPMGSDQFILVPNLIAWLMMGLATSSLVSLGGGNRAGSVFAAGLLLLMPLSVANVHSAHNDLPLAAMFLASVYFSLHAWQQRDGRSGLLATACAGMTLGTKMSGVGYLGLLALLWIWIFLRSWSKGRRPQSAIMSALRDHPLMAVLALASIGLLGSSWYLRNLWDTGNPLGFFQVSLFGRVVWDGATTKALVNQTNLLNTFRLTDPEDWLILGNAMRGSAGLPGFTFIAAALCAPHTLRRQTAGRDALLTMMLLCLASLSIYLGGPWSAKLRPGDDMSANWIGQQMRYGLPFWGLLAAIAGAQLRTRPSPLVGWVLSGVAAVTAVHAVSHSGMFLEWYPRRSIALLVCSVALCLAVTTSAFGRIASSGIIRLVAATKRRDASSIAAATASAFAVMLLLGCATQSALGVRQSVRNSLYGGIARFVDEDLPITVRIAFWGTHKTYLLYGRDLRRHLRPLALPAQASWAELLAYVRAAPVDVIAVGPLIDQPSLTNRMYRMADERSGFQRLHGDDISHHVLVYRLRPATDQ